MNKEYKDFIEDNFQIVNKKGQLVNFHLNAIQSKYLLKDSIGADVILKARQQGFSSLITAIFTADFILCKHSYNVIIADSKENAEGLLEKVKLYLGSYEAKNGVEIPLKYDSKYELQNSLMDSKFIIGTAKRAEFGRSKTITNLHCSEVAFFPDIEKLIAGAGQAVVESGRKIFETTANGFNDFKKFYDDAKRGENGYRALFYKASDFYGPDFLEAKKKELKKLFCQEYPESDVECFLTSGDCYFDTEALKWHLDNVKDTSKGSFVYA